VSSVPLLLLLPSQSPGQDIPVVAREAVFLVSLATEEFIKRITSASRKVAIREKRSVVQHKDLGISLCNSLERAHESTPLAAAVVRKVDEFVFLEGESARFLTCVEA
jgi:DNA polymerase epsilon subunit 4